MILDRSVPNTAVLKVTGLDSYPCASIEIGARIHFLGLALKGPSTL